MQEKLNRVYLFSESAIDFFFFFADTQSPVEEGNTFIETIVSMLKYVLLNLFPNCYLCFGIANYCFSLNYC